MTVSSLGVTPFASATRLTFSVGEKGTLPVNLVAVGDQQVKSDTGRERALTVLARHRAVGGAEASKAI